MADASPVYDSLTQFLSFKWPQAFFLCSLNCAPPTGELLPGHLELSAGHPKRSRHTHRLLWGPEAGAPVWHRHQDVGAQGHGETCSCDAPPTTSDPLPVTSCHFLSPILTAFTSCAGDLRDGDDGHGSGCPQALPDISMHHPQQPSVLLTQTRSQTQRPEPSRVQTPAVSKGW